MNMTISQLFKHIPGVLAATALILVLMGTTVHAGFIYSNGFVPYDVLGECNDTIDNTDPEDFKADDADPGCHTDGNVNNPGTYDPSDPSEIDVVPTTECSDKVDNDDPEDTLVDALDPGCHTDGDAANPATYDPNDTNERNGPDLVATNVSPTSATLGAPTGFTAKIMNIGNISTGIKFPNFFQVATATDGTSVIYNFPSGAPMNILAAGGVDTATTGATTYVFTTVGTYYVRACADKSSPLSTGVVTESDETNNCSAWATITITNDPLGAGINLVASTNGPISPGTAVTLTIHANNFTSGSPACRIDHGVGSVLMHAAGGNNYDSNNGQSNLTVNPAVDTTYTATCFSPSSGSASTYCSSGSFTECGWDNELIDVTTGGPEICNNGLDDDGDGLTDGADPDCPAGLKQCQDTIDNDGDALIDTADPGCHSDSNASNGASYVPTDNDESNKKKPIFIEF